jgi:VIT1/CCC1 family predicted Fe2+/Mn2+ transporter
VSSISDGDLHDVDTIAPHEPVLAVERVRHYLPDLIYGANDGIITTFAIVSGVAGASLSATTALILGLANLFADGFSMGASNVLAIQSQQEVRRARGLPIDETFPGRHGIATFFAFLVAGAVPLLAYALTPAAQRSAVAVLVTLLTLFAAGALRALVTAVNWWRAGLQMLTIGAIAAGVAYGIGALLRVWITEMP